MSPSSTCRKLDRQWYLVAYLYASGTHCRGEWRLAGLDTPTLATILGRTPSALGYDFLYINADQVQQLGNWIDGEVDVEHYQYVVECKQVLKTRTLHFLK